MEGLTAGPGKETEKGQQGEPAPVGHGSHMRRALQGVRDNRESNEKVIQKWSLDHGEVMGASVRAVSIPATTPGRPLPLREACVHLWACPGCALLWEAQPVGRGCPQTKVSLTVTAP